MRYSKRATKGVSLIEAILALVIAGAILIMGFRQYQVYTTDTAAQRVRYNAEEIIRAAALYYYANCERTPSYPTATLDPVNSPSNPYTALKVSDLVASKYLLKAPANNILVDSTATEGGYLIQFNEKTPRPVRYYCTNKGCNPIGYNVIWTIQVSVLMKNPNTASRYFKMSGATCQTTSRGANQVVPCSLAAAFETSCKSYRDPTSPYYNPLIANNAGCPQSGGTYGNYLSWERLPSMSSPKGQSILWLSNPVVKQFKQANEMPSLSDMLANPTTNFLCGS